MITHDQWQRLHALDPRCDIFMERRTEWAAAGPNKATAWLSIPNPTNPHSRRAWHIRIKIRGGVDSADIVDISEPALTDAVARALELAESKSWHIAHGASS
jgi:hypothetical protein